MSKHKFLFLQQTSNIWYPDIKNVIPKCKCLTEGWQWHPETSEIAVLCTKQRGTVAQCSTEVKQSILCLLHASVCLPIVEEIYPN